MPDLILPPEDGRLFYTDEPILADTINEESQTYPILRGGMWPSQRKWWDMRNFIRMFIGGYGAGKTMALAKRMSALSIMNAPIPVATVSPTFPVAKKTIIVTLEDDDRLLRHGEEDDHRHSGGRSRLHDRLVQLLERHRSLPSGWG